jgi:hypothetical protein
MNCFRLKNAKEAQQEQYKVEFQIKNVRFIFPMVNFLL